MARDLDHRLGVPVRSRIPGTSSVGGERAWLWQAGAGRWDSGCSSSRNVTLYGNLAEYARPLGRVPRAAAVRPSPSRWSRSLPHLVPDRVGR